MSAKDKNARVAVRKCVGANAGGGCGRRFVVRRVDIDRERRINAPDYDTKTEKELAKEFVYCRNCAGLRPRKGD